MSKNRVCCSNAFSDKQWLRMLVPPQPINLRYAPEALNRENAVLGFKNPDLEDFPGKTLNIGNECFLHWLKPELGWRPLFHT